jgi:hypothetical protein
MANGASASAGAPFCHSSYAALTSAAAVRGTYAARSRVSRFTSMICSIISWQEPQSPPA